MGADNSRKAPASGAGDGNGKLIDGGELPPKCGIVMPIAEMGECSETHWADVLGILTDAVEDAGFAADIVSNADEVTVIQKTIVQNLYECPVVICDVSQKNPNVMFELGMRLAFDKPTIIVKDDKTTFSFDTGVIEHLEYPRDLRFNKITEFKRRIGRKVEATFKKSKENPEYSTFLKHFGRFEVSKLETTEISGQDYIMKQLSEIRESVAEIKLPPTSRRPLTFPAGHEIDVCCGPMNFDQVADLEKRMNCDNRITSVRVADVGEDHYHIYAASDFESLEDRRELEREYEKIARDMHRGRRLGARRRAQRDLKLIQDKFVDLDHNDEEEPPQ
ncbi:MAG: hypothetical protein ACX930_14690 [Erythrobacter sp.]